MLLFGFWVMQRSIQRHEQTGVNVSEKQNGEEGRGGGLVSDRGKLWRAGVKTFRAHFGKV